MVPDLNFKNVEILGAAIASPIYTIGVGQVLFIPGVLVSGITSSIFGLKEAYYHVRKKMTDKKITDLTLTVVEINKYKIQKKKFEHKKFESKNKALNFAAATSFFALGAIPIIGGPLGVFSAVAILENKEILYWQ